jgi:hypothetical protein
MTCAMGSDASLTNRLQSFMQGDTAAADALLREVLPTLRDIALRELKRERYMAPLSKTELIGSTSGAVWFCSTSMEKAYSRLRAIHVIADTEDARQDSAPVSGVSELELTEKPGGRFFVQMKQGDRVTVIASNGEIYVIERRASRRSGYRV